jgi:hypothetical protein
MALFKARADDAPAGAGPVSREEYEALARELAALRRVTAIAVMALERSDKGGVIAASVRLAQIAAAESDEALAGLNALIDEASSAESEREFRVASARTRALTSDDFMPGGRFAPRVR